MRKVLSLLASATLVIALLASPATVAASEPFDPGVPELGPAPADVDEYGYSVTASELTITPLATWSTKTINRAGRPITGDASTWGWCQGIAYGKVNGRLVLFTASHCLPNSAFGKQIIVEGGHVLGTWGYVPPTTQTKSDLGVIYLASGAHPSTLNRTFRGEDEYGNKLWRTTTVPWPYDAESCDDLAQSGKVNNGNIYQNWQSAFNSGYLNQAGTMTGFDSYISHTTCTIRTTIPQHTAGFKDSGSGFYRGGVGNVPSFVGTRWWDDNGTHRLVVAPLYSGMHDLNNWWTGSGYDLGAWFCYNASCTGNPN